MSEFPTRTPCRRAFLLAWRPATIAGAYWKIYQKSPELISCLTKYYTKYYTRHTITSSGRRNPNQNRLRICRKEKPWILYEIRWKILKTFFLPFQEVLCIFLIFIRTHSCTTLLIFRTLMLCYVQCYIWQNSYDWWRSIL